MTQASFVQRSVALWLASTAAAALVLPHAFAVQAESMRTEVLGGIPPWLFAVSFLVQTSMFSLLGAAMGLVACDAAGLATPVLDGWLARKPTDAKGWLPLAIGVGLAAGLVTAGVDVFTPAAARATGATLHALLAIPHGAIVHEVLLRLLVMGLVVAALRRLGRPATGQAPPWAIASGIVAAALVFGAYQTLAVGRVVALTGPIVVQTFAHHGVGGLACGWLFARRGIVPAMVAHALILLVDRLV